MKFRMDNLGEQDGFMEVEHKPGENWLELGAGYASSHRRASVMHLNRRQALALAAALKGLAASLT